LQPIRVARTVNHQNLLLRRHNHASQIRKNPQTSSVPLRRQVRSMANLQMGVALCRRTIRNWAIRTRPSFGWKKRTKAENMISPSLTSGLCSIASARTLGSKISYAGSAFRKRLEYLSSTDTLFSTYPPSQQDPQNDAVPGSAKTNPFRTFSSLGTDRLLRNSD